MNPIDQKGNLPANRSALAPDDGPGHPGHGKVRSHRPFEHRYGMPQMSSGHSTGEVARGEFPDGCEPRRLKPRTAADKIDYFDGQTCQRRLGK